MSKLFTPNPDRTFMRAVSFKVATPSGGLTQVALDVDYASVPKARLTTMQEEWTDEEVYAEVVRGVHGVGDDDGTELNPEKGKEAMASESVFVYEAVLEYYNVMFGGNLKSKTSRRRRGTG